MIICILFDIKFIIVYMCVNVNNLLIVKYKNSFYCFNKMHLIENDDLTFSRVKIYVGVKLIKSVIVRVQFMPHRIKIHYFS